MTAPMACQLIGRWRIVEANLWDRGYLDLDGPAVLVIREDGHGEIAFGALNASLDLEYGRSIVFFTNAIMLLSSVTRVVLRSSGRISAIPPRF